MIFGKKKNEINKICIEYNKYGLSSLLDAKRFYENNIANIKIANETEKELFEKKKLLIDQILNSNNNKSKNDVNKSIDGKKSILNEDKIDDNFEQQRGRTMIE